MKDRWGNIPLNKIEEMGIEIGNINKGEIKKIDKIIKNNIL